MVKEGSKYYPSHKLSRHLPNNRPKILLLSIFGTMCLSLQEAPATIKEKAAWGRWFNTSWTDIYIFVQMNISAE